MRTIIETGIDANRKIRRSSMGKQTTISKTARFSGIGLHTGNMTTIECRPAPSSTGIVFVRDDMQGKPHIPASVENVLGVMRGTTIGTREVHVHTVEHLLAACYALNIDNLFIHMDANEPPVADGSSLPFIEMLEHAGITDLDADRIVARITEPVHYESGQTIIDAFPIEQELLKVSTAIIYNHPLIKHQKVCFEITPEIFKREIAPSRTFCLDYEIEALKKKGLAKGGSLNNAVVIGMDQIFCKGSLRFPDEFVRHKLLDFVGDLSLLTMPLYAEIHAVKTGHGHNINFTRQLFDLLKNEK